MAVAMLLVVLGASCSSGDSDTGEAETPAFGMTTLSVSSSSRFEPLTEQQTWNVRERVVFRGDSPFFPIGFYYVSHYPELKARRLVDIEKIAAAGFNVVHTPIDLHDRAFLDKAASLGVSVAVEFNADPEELLQQVGNHPAVAFLGTFDDVDAPEANGAPRHDPDFVQHRSAALKHQAPSTLTYVSGGFPDRIGAYAGRTDLLAMQMYPIPDESLAALSRGYLPSLMNVAAAHQQAVIANLQTFGWHGRHRYPTPSEVRNMTYQALGAGVNGIIYYTFFDPVTDLNGQPELWAELRRISGEVQRYEPYLLSGARTLLSSPTCDVLAARWELPGSALALLVNVVDHPSSVRLDLGSGYRVAAARCEGPEGSREGPRSHEIIDTLAAAEVCIFELIAR